MLFFLAQHLFFRKLGGKRLDGSDVLVPLALLAIVFMTYFILGIAGFRVHAGGEVRVPRAYAWLLVAVLTILTLVTMVTIAFFLKA